MSDDIRVLLSEENDRLTDTVAKQAAEIDRLRAALREYVCDCKGGCDADASFNIHWKCGNTARAALENSNG